ncbi:MAG: hypothetical protein J7623_21190 [Chitinophaga sp.]|uniref:hypothetical protein n=1 Tax=Chitinophaga sp. TaxID=1869181 RepID=UPI001B0AAFA5|nr:hypothetical protein [Chitinophaga sp.]MBO9731167.1 hypothetical protein [Chitinophaga sp.]
MPSIVGAFISNELIMNYVHAVDWLQIHVKCPVTIQAIDTFRYHTEKLDYQTRQFREVYEISVLMPSGAFEKCASLVCKPHASFLGGDMGLLKIENKFLYQDNLKGFVIELLRQYHLKFHAISRLDLALDFTSFAGDLNPADFIRGFLNGTYVKKHRANFAILGSHKDSTNLFEYLRFGSKVSEVNYYLYNKSVELDAKKNKPWIRQMWQSAGFPADATVWRLEFSLKSSCKELVEYDFGEVTPVKALAILDPNQSFTFYKTLFHKHFSFYESGRGGRKDRLTPVLLLELDKPNTVLMRLTEKAESSRMDKIFIKRWEAENHTAKRIDKNYFIYGARMLMEFLIKRDLVTWYLQHFPGGSAELSILGRRAGLINETYEQATIF